MVEGQFEGDFPAEAAPVREDSWSGAAVEQSLTGGRVGGQMQADAATFLGTNFQLTDRGQAVCGDRCGPPTPGALPGTGDGRPAPSDRGAAPTDSSDRGAGRLSDKIAGFMQKLGQFLDRVLPPEWAQPARQFLSQISRFMSENLRDVNFGRNADGSQHVGVDIGREVTIPKAVQGQDLQVGPNVSFDTTMGPNGPELKNIKGLKVKVAGGLVDADVRSARLTRDAEGRLQMEARVKAGVLPESTVTIPLHRATAPAATRRR
ncbi:MAG: hypothetical protein K2W95_18195 [Candidatus Obscuribacterales bacterium]|nr:hypothetical protein [Candidatus Obscuribacterales bacterium]